MARRGGLGRGLDSLIPDKTGKTRKKSTEKSEQARKSKKDKTKAASAEQEKDLINKESTDADMPETDLPAGEKDIMEQEVKESEKVETAAEQIQEAADDTSDGKVISLRISLVEPNRNQPRKFFDDEAIEELSDSIKQFGIISPLLVQKKEDYYEIIAGERRWRAAQKAGLKEVPVLIKDFSNQEAVEVSLIENIQREDLNPIEEAKAYDRLVSEYGMNQEEVAGRVSKSRSAIANSMRLLKLDPEVQRMVETGAISEGHGRALLTVADPDVQKEIAGKIVTERLSVRQTEKLVRDMQKAPASPRRKSRDVRRETLLNDLAEQLKGKLGTKVNIRQNGKNKGKIEIEY
jgi:ParB family chromosome partitioning protein